MKRKIYRLMRRIKFRIVHYYNDNIRYNKFIKNISEAKIEGKTYGKKRLICSITTIPPRIQFVKYPILSILHQEVVPDRIVLYLGQELFKNIDLPEELLELQEHGLEIRYVDDVRVHTKYYYAFQEFKDDLVMTADDDILYSKKLTKELLLSHEKYPEAVICSRAHRMTYENGMIKPYFKWDWEYKSTKPSMDLVATGVGGVLYDPSLFSFSPCNKELFLSLAPNNDDLWLKGVQFANGIKVLTLKGYTWWTEIKDSQSSSLNSSNVHEHRNDEYMENISNYFGMTVDKIKSFG